MRDQPALVADQVVDDLPLGTSQVDLAIVRFADERSVPGQVES